MIAAKCIQACALLLAVAVVAADPAPAIVKVGGYAFPPFVEFDKEGHPSGMTMDMIALFNASQQQFYFQFASTTPKRRYQNFIDGKFDMMLFEDKKWGWEEYSASVSQPFLTGREVYIAQSVEGRDQRFFDNIKDKKIIAMLGYHYGFADFSSDEAFLKSNFTIYLTTNHKNIIRAVADGSSIADVAVVTESYLSQYLRDYPQYQNRLLISDRNDQIYRHTALIKDDAQVSVKDINALLKSLESQGKLQEIWQKYGLQ